MILEMKVPSPGESITEVEIAQWLVENGDYVEKDQAIAEVDSDKATLELPAEVSGTITLKAEEGDAVEVGEIVCMIDTEGKPSTENKAVVEAVKDVKKPEEILNKETYASGSPSPAAKKIISEKNIDISSIKGTGRDGRITKNDVIKGKVSMGTIPENGNRDQATKKMSLLRRKVAERLVSAKNETAMLTTFNEVDMSGIFEIRKKFKESFTSKHGVGLGFMSFFYKGSC
jgi:2-oxoglutarate dehydrogenase E2 component (dihydrolipoamide succinyltransferase)